MDYSRFEEEAYLQSLWSSVQIAREIPYGLFTFGDSELRYYLVLKPRQSGDPVKIRQGEIRVSRPLIITPQNARPEFQDFFESVGNEAMINFLMTRSAAFSNLRLSNTSGPEKIVSDQAEEVIDKLNRQLDSEEEDRIAILVAPENLAGIALIRLAAERIVASAPDNLNELRERGLLP